MYAIATAHPGGAVTGPSLPCRHPSDRGRHRIVSTLIPHVCAPAYICSLAYICLRRRLRQLPTRDPFAVAPPTHIGHSLTAFGYPNTNAEGSVPWRSVRAPFGSFRSVACQFCVFVGLLVLVSRRLSTHCAMSGFLTALWAGFFAAAAAPIGAIGDACVHDFEVNSTFHSP